jgi:hypothetical protein
MKRIVAVAALVLTLARIAPAPAQAGGGTSAALGLASFAVFNQLVLPAWPIRIAGRRRDERASVGVDRESRGCALWRTGARRAPAGPVAPLRASRTA